MAFENTAPRTGNAAIRLVLDRSVKAVFFVRSHIGLGVALKINNKGGASCVGLGRKKCQPNFSLFIEDFFSVNFEDELAIIHEENANVLNVVTSSYSDAQDQRHNRKVRYYKQRSQKVLPYNKAFIKRLLDPCWKIFGP